MGAKGWLVLAPLVFVLGACGSFSQTVRLDSYPRGAMVYLNGGYRGLTPIETSIPLGSRSFIRGVEVLLIKEGYRAERATIILGEKSSFFFWLRPAKEGEAP